MPFFFGFAGPESVFVVVAGELLAGAVHDAVGAEPVRLGFSTGACLRAFSLGWEEESGVATTVGQGEPIVGMLGRHFQAVES